MSMIKFNTTGRGFHYGIFKDRYDVECSIQDSSLATERCIWLGVNNDNAPRMHLTVEMAKELVVLLNRFVETGSIAEKTS